ncbi:MAG: hypothetical protein QW358_04730, partial [Candidatus Hadarchaeum sp.]
AIFAVWLWMKVLERAGGVKHSKLLKVITTLIIMIPFFLIPYVADSQHLIKNGLEGMIPFYVLANAAYVFLAGIVTLVVVRTRWRLVLLSGLFLAFLFLHFVLYVPMSPDFYWI